MPGLIVENARAFLDFTKTVFGAQEQYIRLRSEGNIMHGEIAIGPAVSMFADATGAFKRLLGSLFLYVENVDETFQKAMVADVKLLQPLENRAYGRGGGFEDIFGNHG